MQALLHKLAILLITLHVVGGCCLHHAHTWDRQHAAAARLSVESFSMPHEHPCSECPDRPGQPSDPCREGTCQYLVPQKTRLCERPLMLPPVNFLGSCSYDDTPLYRSQSEALIAAHSPAWHGLRLHLVEQVLLL